MQFSRLIIRKEPVQAIQGITESPKNCAVLSEAKPDYRNRSTPTAAIVGSECSRSCEGHVKVGGGGVHAEGNESGCRRADIPVGECVTHLV